MEDIKAILGSVDEALISQIIQTGASADELADAWTWLNADETLINEGRPLPKGRVAELISLLEAAEVDNGD